MFDTRLIRVWYAEEFCKMWLEAFYNNNNNWYIDMHILGYIHVCKIFLIHIKKNTYISLFISFPIGVSMYQKYKIKSRRDEDVIEYISAKNELISFWYFRVSKPHLAEYV